MARNTLDRSFGDSSYRYCRADGSDVFFTTASSGTNFNEGVAAPVTRLLDYYYRELVHVVSGNYILAFDRMKKASGGGATNAFVPWHTINQAIESGADKAYADSGGNRLWRRTFHKPTGTTYVNRNNSDLIYSDTTGSRSFRQEYTIPLTVGYAYMLTAFQVTADTVGSMQAMSVVPATGVGLPIDHTFIGVTIDEAIPKHFLFTYTPDGSIPSTLVYYVQKTGSTDVHRCFGLLPGQEYFITETLVSGSYYKYTLTPTFNVGRYANSAGILEFTPADIGTIGTNYYNVGIDDSTTTNSASTVTSTATFNLTVTDNGGSVGSASDVTAEASGVSNTYNITVDDTGNPTAGSSSSLAFTTKMSVEDTSGTALSSVSVEREGSPQIIETEKRIDGPIATLVPDGDISNSYFTMEPNDGELFSKVNDADDGDFIKVIPTPFFRYSYAIFSMSDNSGTVSTIRSLQFAVKIRSAQFTFIDQPYLRLTLYRGAVDNAHVAAIYDIALYGTEDPVWLRSPVIPLLVDRSEIPNLYFSLRPRAATYLMAGSYNLEISSAFIDVSGDAVEKVV